MTYIDLYQSAIDWFTITSFEQEFYNYWDNRLAPAEEEREVKRQQYIGTTYKLDRGTAYLGVAFQKGIQHYMLRLTGGSAEDCKDAVYAQLRQRFVECTRIDLQVTVPMPKTWNQFELLQRMNAKG